MTIASKHFLKISDEEYKKKKENSPFQKLFCFSVVIDCLLSNLFTKTNQELLGIQRFGDGISGFSFLNVDFEREKRSRETKIIKLKRKCYQEREKKKC